MDTTAAPVSVPATQPQPSRWRQVFAWVLLVIFCLGMVLSTVTIWVRNQALDTDTFVETASPLAADPDIQQAIATRVSTLISERLQRDDVLVGSSDGLLRQLAIPVVQDWVYRQTLEFVQSPEFQGYWDSAIELAHQGFVTALTSDAERTLTVQDGQLILDLSPLVARVNERLQASGFNLVSQIQIDPARATYVLFESDTIADIQWALEWLDPLAIILPVVSLVALIGCLLLARDRWSMAMWAALGVAIGMVLLLVGLRIAREAILDNLPPERSSAAVASVFDIVTRNLRDAARLLALLSLIVGGFCGLAGSSWVRQPGVVTFVARYRAALLGGIVAVACVVLVAADEVSPRLAIGIGVVALASIVSVIWISRLPVPAVAHAPPPPAAPGPEGLPTQAT
jgi:hypothetical protein